MSIVIGRVFESGAGFYRDVNDGVRRIFGRGVVSGVGSDVGSEFESDYDGEVEL